jgi:hypothetical protein
MDSRRLPAKPPFYFAVIFCKIFLGLGVAREIFPDVKMPGKKPAFEGTSRKRTHRFDENARPTKITQIRLRKT